MASVTLGQHLAQHLRDPDQQLLHKLKSGDRKKFARKWSLEKIKRSRASDVDSARAAVSASLMLFNHEPPSASHNRDCSSGWPRSGMDGSPADMDRENANNNNGIFRRHSAGSRRSSGKSHASSSLQEVRNTSPRCNFICPPPDELEGLQIDRLTRGKSGVVKMRNEPLRREAWSIFNQRDPRVKAEKGEGHSFTSTPLSQDWCDACSRQISSAALKCQNCSYTCHLECQGLVQLDCNQLERRTEDVSDPNLQRPCARDPQETNVTKEEEEDKPISLTEEEIKAKIDDYNSKVTENGMKLNPDGTYTGFIKVHLRLRRPVTVLFVDGKLPGPCSSSDDSDNRTSFYLPADAVKQLHISSTTTVREVIQGLLKKFMVQDNPRKFALCRLTRRDSQDLFQKLPLSDCPLYLRLLAGPDLDNLSFVLKENETGEVEWHAFSVPELQNFLIILEKEEKERMRQVEQRYSTYREKLLQALGEVESKPG
ncbi:ras association domain-containing protein 5 isoform X1 [Danio rerio]|uniref:Ras association domain-containing protein 5 isoform X1 n=1 Tax=Danio rerio TaxID=7955 RepID=A0A8M1QHH2_DANRE|nr:ras association domain-containing protein 5 isoform X1 [Danio rerio]|eukprot:XP_001920863.5 ras association domain-containing protein 5 isoform X1 [Danio rerio]